MRSALRSLEFAFLGSWNLRALVTKKTCNPAVPSPVWLKLGQFWTKWSPGPRGMRWEHIHSGFRTKRRFSVQQHCRGPIPVIEER